MTNQFKARSPAKMRETHNLMEHDNPAFPTMWVLKNDLKHAQSQGWRVVPPPPPKNEQE